ncbi:MAG: signal peptidase II, partial [Bacilli bacterium]|nr:signal peptidase II [Bacilli bacterium]
MKKKIVFISAVCLIVDQLSKALLEHFLELNQSIDIVPSFFSITYVRNEGAAWSLFSGNQVFLILMSFIALYIIYTYFIKNKFLNTLELWSYG